MRKSRFICGVALLLCTVSACRSRSVATEIADGLAIDTLMYGGGHSFGNVGDITEWGGWYFDTVPVGYDFMLRYDSVGPSSLRLNLVTREMVEDLGEPGAGERIRRFMGPIEGFKRFTRKYEVVIDSVDTEEIGVLRTMGYFSFVADYVEKGDKAEMINRFVCQLACDAGRGEAGLNPMHALYIGHSLVRGPRKAYKGSVMNMAALSDFVYGNTLENWRSGNASEMGGNAVDIAVRAQVANPAFVTYSTYAYDREGLGHGMYYQYFHTLDLSTGKALTNDDIFKADAVEKVKRGLCEVMLEDPVYREFHPSLETPDDIMDIYDKADDGSGNQADKPKKTLPSELPKAALTDRGVVFSYQPYDLGGWAEGAHNFVVPYDKLKGCLTPRVQRMIGGFNPAR